MTVEQREAGVVSDEVDLDFLVASDHDDVFHEIGNWFACQLGEFETMPVKMDWIYVVAALRIRMR